MTLDNRCGAGMDPAAALQVPAVIEPGQTIEIVFLLGEHTTVDRVRELVRAIFCRRKRGTGLGGDSKVVGRETRIDSGPHTVSLHQLPAESLAAVPEPELPLLGAIRALPVRRSLRIPRPVAGRHGLLVLGAGIGPRAHSRWRRRVNSPRAMCSTGGIPSPASASGPAVRTICCGCPTRLHAMSRLPEMTRFWTWRCRFSKAPSSKRMNRNTCRFPRSPRPPLRCGNIAFAPSNTPGGWDRTAFR